MNLINCAQKVCVIYFYLTWSHNYVLYVTGVDGVKAKVFGTSMDTKGREELLGKT